MDVFRPFDGVPQMILFYHRTGIKHVRCVVTPYKIKFFVPGENFLEALEEYELKNNDRIKALALERAKLREDPEPIPSEPLTPAEIDALTVEAQEYFPRKAKYYADRVGETVDSVKVELRRSYWGLCSHRADLTFNVMLMVCPEEVRDAIVAHEVCHLVYRDHQEKFYALLREIYPDYDRCDKWLKQHNLTIDERFYPPPGSSEDPEEPIDF